VPGAFALADDRSMLTSRIRTPFATLAALALAALVPAAASAAPKVDGEFAVSSTPGQLTQGPDGNIWAVVGTKIARVAPDGTVTEFDPADVETAVGITSGPDGNLWVTQTNGVAKIPPADPLSAKKFTIPEITSAQGITTGPDGNLWTASNDAVIKIPPADPTTKTVFTVAGLGPRGIASGGDGQLWVADFAGNQVVSVTTAGATKGYPVGGGLQGIAAGPGTQIAYANPGANPQHVGRITPGASALKTELSGDPFGITFGPDGAYWSAQFAAGKIARLTTGGAVTELGGFSAGSGPRYIAAGPGNTLWVSRETANKIARVTGVVAPAATGDKRAPALSRLSLKGASVRAGAAARLRFTLSEAARVRVTIERKRGGGKLRFRQIATLTRKGTTGRNALRLGTRVGGGLLSAGRYRVTLTAVDAVGNAGRPARVALRIVSRGR